MAFLLKHYTFSAKIRNLAEFHTRILTNSSPPSGLDVANTLRYFQQTLLGFLKDVPNPTVELFESQRGEQERLALFPNLKYDGLHQALMNIIDVFPNVTSGQIALGQAILNTINCLYLFLDREYLDYLTYTVSVLLSTFPEQLHDDILHSLCDILLPFTMSREDQDNSGRQSAADVMLMVFQYSTNPKHHAWLIETLMSLRPNVFKDVISVIACGTSEARIPAANLLFHYWPLLNPNILDRRSVQYRPQVWQVVRCQHKECSSGDNNFVVKKCLHPGVCSEVADLAPPVYVCAACAAVISDQHQTSLFDICRPISSLANVCQNKACQSNSRVAVALCFSIECRLSNNLEPLKLCQACHDARHTERGHLCHTRIPVPWDLDNYTQVKFVEAVVRLLKECTFMTDTDTERRPKWLQQIEGNQEVQDAALADEKRMLSRYGIWLLVGLCTPRADTPEDATGRLLAMLFQWFGTTALLPNDQTGTALEHLKGDYICNWLPKVIKNNYTIFVNCLLPHPPEYARVGGQWDMLSTHTEQLKEGLSRILALIPYDIIDFETWDKIMPHWLDAISTEVPLKELPELKILLCKIFEVDMCALPFPPEQIYNFIENRLKTGDIQTQQQAMDWLQCLSELNIQISADTLLRFIKLSVKALTEAAISNAPKKRVSLIPRESICNQDGLLFDDDLQTSPPGSPGDSPTFQAAKESGEGVVGDSGNVLLFITILDILQKQMDLMDFKPHAGVGERLSQEILTTITEVLKANWTGHHVCDNPELDDFVDCSLCKDTTVFYEFLLEIVQRICPKDAVKFEIPQDSDMDALMFASSTDDLESTARSGKAEGGPGGLTPGGRSLESVLPGQPQLLSVVGEEEGPRIFQATQQTEMQSMEFACILPTEEIESAVAEAMTLSETDVGLATCKVITATLVGEGVDQKPPTAAGGETTDMHFWHTSLGKFRFTLEELPAQLQMIHAMLQDIEKHPDPDVSYFMLLAIRYLCLHAEALKLAHRENRGFLIWSQEHIFIPKFWKLLQTEYSQVSDACVPLILHCLTLPCGVDVFWKVVNDDFCSPDWTTRFGAVERATLIGRFLEPAQVRGNTIIQAALANVFCFLIGAVSDNCPTVAQCATLYLETVKSTAMKCLCGCLEAQYDAVAIDRPLITNRLFTLSSLLPNQPILSWEFFLQRFDQLSIEAQILLEKTGEVAFPTDLMHTDPMSDLYQRKVTKARNALDPPENMKSIVRIMAKSMEQQKAQSSESSKVASVKDPTSKPATPTLPTVMLPQQSLCRSTSSLMQSHLRKVVLLVRVVNAWKGFKQQLSRHASFLSLAALSRRSSAGTNSMRSGKTDAGDRSPGTEVGETTLPKSNRSSTVAMSGVDPAGAIGRLKEFTDQESNFAMILNKAMDLDNPERHTVYLMITLFMKFLSNPKTSVINPDEKAAAKKQSIVLRHLNLILGYSTVEKNFSVPPARLRSSAICNSFLASLPYVLDNNLMIGAQILPTALSVLQYLPSPQKYASDFQEPSYSLWHLEVQTRHSWLWSTLLILYKYKFDQPPVSDQVLALIKLIIMTLEAQTHRCHTVEATVRSPLFPRSRDLSSEGHSPNGKSSGKLRRLLKRVLLMVRVVRNWPRSPTGEGFPDRSTKEESSESSLSSLTDGRRISRLTEASETGLTPEQEEMLMASQSSASASLAYQFPSTSGAPQRRSRQYSGALKQPTFDEREEHMLEDMQEHADRYEAFRQQQLEFADAIETMPEFATIQQPGLQQKVEYRIVEQISEFDRSFGKAPKVVVRRLSSATSPTRPEALEVIQPAATPLQPQFEEVKDFEIMEPMEYCQFGQSIAVRSPLGEEEPPSRCIATASGPTVYESQVSTEVLSPEAGKDKLQVIKETGHLSVKGPEAQQVFPKLVSKQQGMVMQPSVAIVHEPSSVSLRAIGDDYAPPSSTRSSIGGATARSSISSLGEVRKPTVKPAQPTIEHEPQPAKEKKWHHYDQPQVFWGAIRFADSTVVTRCVQCNVPLEFYDEDTISLSIVCLAAFVRREPGMAASYLLRILQTVARIANHTFYPWQAESNLFVPGNCRSVARQCLRVVLHQLAPNRLFYELFQCDINDDQFLKTVTNVLADFTELNPAALVGTLLEDINECWVPGQPIAQVLHNLSAYVSFVQTENYLPSWAIVVTQFDAFLRTYTAEARDIRSEFVYLFRILTVILKVQNIATLKIVSTFLDSAGKLVSQALQSCPVPLKELLLVCSACNKAFVKEKERQTLSRAATTELLNALKFKGTLSEGNYLTLVQFVLQDIGETLASAKFDISTQQTVYNTAAGECIRPSLQDLIEFIGDLHVLHKTKTLTKSGFHEDTLGGELKSGLARYIAMEIAKGNARDPRTVVRYLPWLFSPPQVTQQGPTEFVECVAHLRMLSWILLGALLNHSSVFCHPIPLDSSQYVSDHIQFVLAGFAEQSKESVLHMSSLFHAFHLCQLWTIYSEQATEKRPSSQSAATLASSNVMDFWARLTPAVIQLLSHSKVLADMVNLHFLNTIEALQECGSAVLARLYPLWRPLLLAYHAQIPSHLMVRLDACENQLHADSDAEVDNKEQLKAWLKRIKFKISQIELQSSAATQFYSV